MMLPLPPSSLPNSAAASLPPATLSDAMKDATLAPVTVRSTAMTGILAVFRTFTGAAAPSESTGFRMTAWTFWDWAFASWLACVAASFCASTTLRVTPSAAASATAPSFSETKNGLFSVETASVIFFALDDPVALVEGEVRLQAASGKIASPATMAAAVVR